MFNYIKHIYRYNVCLIGIGKSRKRFSSMAFSSEDFNYSRSSSVNSSTSKSKCTSINMSLHSKSILLNPGAHYEIEAQDICYYISLVKEENYNWKGSKATRNCMMLISILKLEFLLMLIQICD